MKFNMETAYVPYTSIFEKKDMMHDWRNTSNYAAFLGYIVAVLSFIAGFSCSDFGDFFEFSMYGATVGLVVGGAFCRKWKIFAYYLNVISVVYCDTIAAFYIKEMTTTPIAAIIGINLFSIPMIYFCLRCIYNYTPVFKELKKSKGFPAFVVNSADLYADKIYLKDKKSEEKINISEKKSAPLIMNIDVKPTQEEIKERKTKKYKHRLSILGINIIFPHDDPKDMSFDDKKGYMYDWNSNVEFARSGFFIHVLFMMAGVLFCVIGSGAVSPIIIGYSAIAFYIFGLNYMKIGKLKGAFITIGGLVMYFLIIFTITNSATFIPIYFIFVVSITNIKILLPTIRYIINYPTYKELSTHEGFPSFVRNNADLYGDKIYIVEKREAIKRRVLNDNEKFEMNFGYEEKPKKQEDKAWNAFNYMDEEKEEKDEN